MNIYPGKEEPHAGKYLISINCFFNILIYALFIWFVGVPLVKDGMFLDGVQYAAVARNLALGLGTWWEPHYSATLFNHFHQQPPGFIWLQSLFFRMLNDSIYPERIYCFLEGIIMLLLIAHSWKTINPDPSIRQMTWLPQLIWLCIPTVSWGLRNNVVENTMVIFDWLSVLFLIRLFNKRNETISFVLAVFFLFCASFIKGFQALFPLAVPAIYWLTLRKISFKKMMVISMGLLASVAAIYFLLMRYPPALTSYREYFAARLTDFPHTPTETTTSRTWLLTQMAGEFVVPVLLFLWAMIFMLIKNNYYDEHGMLRKRYAIFFLLAGISASFPLFISFEQRTFYLITSIPFFATSTSLFFAPVMQYLLYRYSPRIKYYRMLQTGAVIFLVSGIITGLASAGKLGRDQDLLSDVRTVVHQVGSNKIVSVSDDIWSQWILDGYFQRYGNISLAKDCDSCRIYLQRKGDNTSDILGYKRINCDTKYLNVYKISH